MDSVHPEEKTDRTKRARLEFRISMEDKLLIQKAASVTGMSQTDFVMTCVKEYAKKKLHEHEILRLTKRDRDLFIETYLNPPEPNARLRKAARNYLKRTNS